MDAEQTDDGEVAQHAVKRLAAVVTSNSRWLLTTLHSSQLLVDLGALDQGVQNVKNAVATPGIWIVAQELDLLLVRTLTRNLIAVRAEVVELVDKLVNDIPRPVVLQNHVSLVAFCGVWFRPYGWWLQIDWSVRVQDEMEQAAVVVIALEFDLKRRREIKRLSSSRKSSLNVVCLLSHAHAAVKLGILKLDLLLVLGDQDFLLDVRLIV
jgi:hypothetical protein